MSGDDQETSVEGKDAEASGPEAGERLADARREQQIPIAEIAKELHLDEYKVRALERNEFDVIGAPVFAKGHLRKYAQLVGVSVDDVMADYHLLDRRHGAPPEISLRSKPRREISPGPWIAVLLAAIVIAAVYWWIAGGPASTDAETNIAPPQPEGVVAEFADAVSRDEPATVAVTDSDNSANEVDDLPAAAPQSERNETVEEAASIASADESAVEVVDASQLRLSVTFSGDCWTEITDANGQRLFFNLGVAGRTINLNGEAPFNVLFGNAENVSLRVNGEPYLIAAESRRGRTARMTITATAARQ